MLGFRGHFSTKSHRYSTTLGALRDARAEWRRAQAAASEPTPETTYVRAHWVFAGTGLSDAEAWLAASIEPAPGTEGGRAVDQQIARTYASLNRLLEEELKGRGGTLLVDEELRRLIRRSMVEFWAPWCEWCDHALPTRVTHVDFEAVLCRDAPLSRPRGRPRRYCSAACRQKAYRWRRAIAEQPVDAE